MLNKTMDRVAIVLNYMNFTDTINIVEKLILSNSLDHIIIVDNASNNNSFDILSERFINDNVEVVRTFRNNGYAYGNNFGARKAIDLWGDEIVIFIVNPDVNIYPKTIDTVAKYIEIHKNDGIGQVAPRLANGSIEGAWKFTSINSILIFDGLMSPILKKVKRKKVFYSNSYQGKSRKVDVLLGAFFGIYGKTFRSVNFFDENTFLYTEEQILALRLRKMGYRNIQLLDIEYEHCGGSSTSNNQKTNGFFELYKSRRYLMKEYLNANIFQLALYDFNFYVSFKLRKVLWKD